jgi:hypothetical protein
VDQTTHYLPQRFPGGNDVTPEVESFRITSLAGVRRRSGYQRADIVSAGLASRMALSLPVGLRIWRPYLASTPHLTFNQAIRYLAGFHNPLNSGQLMGVQFASAVAGGLLLFGRLSRREEMGASPVNGATAFRKLKNRVVMARVHANEGVTQDDEHS